MQWVVVVSVIFMLVYTTLGAKLGAVAKNSPGDLIRDKAGSWLAMLLGLCVFLISAAFQSGNNLGVAAAFEAFVDRKEVVIGLLVAFNALAITFLFAFRNLYRMIERLMTVLVGVMVVCFGVNLFTLRPNLIDLAKGFVPSPGTFDIAVLGLIGTTFVITASFYQAYLVRQKGWGPSEVRSGIIDARIGAVLMTLITVMLIATAAAGLHTGEEVELKDPVAVAVALEPTFGTTGKLIFCFGLFSAAYSSFLVNSMIAGFIVSDGFGWGSTPRDLGPRVMTSIALLTGMSIALAALIADFDRTPTIIFAQAITVVGAPLVAAILFWLTSSHDVMGEHENRLGMRFLAALGLGLLIAIGANTAISKLPTQIRQYQESFEQDQRNDEGTARVEYR